MKTNTKALFGFLVHGLLGITLSIQAYKILTIKVPFELGLWPTLISAIIFISLFALTCFIGAFMFSKAYECVRID